jgi:hypothetical protein
MGILTEGSGSLACQGTGKGKRAQIGGVQKNVDG